MTNLNKKCLPTAPEGASTREVSAVRKGSAPALSYLFIYKRKKQTACSVRSTNRPQASQQCGNSGTEVRFKK